MAKPYTHILFSYPKDNAHSLYRANNGMHLAYQQGVTVIFGNDPNPAKKEHRSFLDERFALAYLRWLADADASGCRITDAEDVWAVDHSWSHAASIEERGGLIVSPTDADLANKAIRARSN